MPSANASAPDGASIAYTLHSAEPREGSPARPRIAKNAACHAGTPAITSPNIGSPRGAGVVGGQPIGQSTEPLYA